MCYNLNSAIPFFLKVIMFKCIKDVITEMAYSLLDNEISNTSVGDTSGVNMLSDLSRTHQMDLLAQNFDDISMNSSSNVRIPYASVVSGRMVTFS